MTHTSYKLEIALVAAALALFLGFAFTAIPAKANPFVFLASTPNTGSTATSTEAFVPSGGSSTVTFDSYAQGQPKATDKGVLLLQTTASSTSSIYTISLQYSQDGIDWYGDNLLATTTAMNVAAANTYSFTAAGTSLSLKAINITLPTRYVRAVVAVSGANGSVWAQIVPQRQSN